MSYLPWLDDSSDFPPLEQALVEPNGLLAAGGDLSVERLRQAYRQGIFPWYTEDQPVLWWSPTPRCVVFPDQIHASRSLRKHIRKTQATLSFDTQFETVIRHCARLDTDEGTWITPDMEQAYIQLFQTGVAHSVEVWEDGVLTGGLYGLAIGRCFFGESMFSLRSNSSKIAFVSLCHQLHAWGYQLVDCQVENPHLLSLGATTIDRCDFLSILKANIDYSPSLHIWQFDHPAISI